MKKLLTLTLVLLLVVAVAVPAMAAGALSKEANSWYYTTDEAGTLTVNDNKVTYTYEVEVGKNFLGLQNNYTGQLAFVDFEATHVHDYVKTFVGAEVAVTIENATGNQNPYTFVITEEYAWICECGDTLENTFEDTTYVINLNNNYKGTVTVGDYEVYIYSYGNDKVRDDVHIVE